MVFTIIVEIWPYKLVKLDVLTKGKAMLQITDEVLKNIETTTSRALVGESCKIIEEIEKQSLPTKESLSLVKSLIRNKIYESARNHTQLITKFSEGVTFNIEFTKPKE
jgi:hypothetical protein